MGTDQDRADLQVQTVCLLILTAVAVGVAMSLLQPVLVPFFLALFLTYCLTPVIDLLHRRLGLPRPLALIGAGLVGLLALLLFGFLAAASVARITRGLEGYQARLHELTEEVAR